MNSKRAKTKEVFEFLVILITLILFVLALLYGNKAR